MNLKKKKVFVTGAAGFIASHLVEALIKRKANVACLVRYNSRNHWGFLDSFPTELKSKIDVVTGDLKDHDAMRKAVRGHDVIFHLGALIAIPYSYVHPYDFIQTNILGTANMLSAALEENVERFVHTSTSEVYGTPKSLPISETFPLQAQSPYSATKIAADKLAESFHKSYGLKVVTVRPFNTYGPRQSARAVIPTIITQALKSNKIFIGSLHPKRDYTYVTDTATGFIQAAECDRLIGDVVNLGTGDYNSIGSIIEKIKKILGKDLKVVQEKQRIRPQKSEVLKLCADISKAKAMFNWQPKVSIDEGLSRTVRWISDNIDLYKHNIYTK